MTRIEEITERLNKMDTVIDKESIYPHYDMAIDLDYCLARIEKLEATLKAVGDTE